MSPKSKLDRPPRQIRIGGVGAGVGPDFVRHTWTRGTHAHTGCCYLYFEKFLVRQAEEFFYFFTQTRVTP